MFPLKYLRINAATLKQGAQNISASKSTSVNVCSDEEKIQEEKPFTNSDIKPVKTFINRNPRNLERLALGHQDIGWGKLLNPGNSPATSYPRRDYYHRICLDRTCSHTDAWLEHYYGSKVIFVSTRQWQVRKLLYRSTDVMACAVLGSILVERCIRAGISCAAWIPLQENESEASKAFCDSMTKAGFSLEEPTQIWFKRRLAHIPIPGPKPPKIVE